MPSSIHSGKPRRTSERGFRCGSAGSGSPLDLMSVRVPVADRARAGQRSSRARRRPIRVSPTASAHAASSSWNRVGAEGIRQFVFSLRRATPAYLRHVEAQRCDQQFEDRFRCSATRASARLRRNWRRTTPHEIQQRALEGDRRHRQRLGAFLARRSPIPPFDRTAPNTSPCRARGRRSASPSPSAPAGSSLAGGQGPGGTGTCHRLLARRPSVVFSALQGSATSTARPRPWPDGSRASPDGAMRGHPACAVSVEFLDLDGGKAQPPSARTATTAASSTPRQRQAAGRPQRHPSRT